MIARPGLARDARSWLTLLVVALVVGCAGLGTYAAFTSSGRNPDNVFAAGTVRLSDDDAGSILFSLTGLKPGDPATSRCVGVTYDGSLDANVRLYATVSGALAPHLDVTVTRGALDPGDSGCGSFAADGTDYLGMGAGVVYASTLGDYPASFETGVADPPSGPEEVWTTSESHAYRFDVSVRDEPGAQGASAAAELFWEARNT